MIRNHAKMDLELEGQLELCGSTNWVGHVRTRTYICLPLLAYVTSALLRT